MPNTLVDTDAEWQYNMTCKADIDVHVRRMNLAVTMTTVQTKMVAILDRLPVPRKPAL
jgi:hypothetical protein